MLPRGLDGRPLPGIGPDGVPDGRKGTSGKQSVSLLVAFYPIGNREPAFRISQPSSSRDLHANPQRSSLTLTSPLLSTLSKLNRYGYHIPSVQRRDAYYAKLQSSKDEQQE
jgi:hypothetical protein